MHLLDGLDGVEVVDSWVQTDLVHDCDAGVLCSLIQLKHGWRDIGSGDNVLLLADGRLDNSGMESVWDEGNDQVVFADSGVQSLLVGDIEGDWGSVLDAFGELLCALKGTAC